MKIDKKGVTVIELIIAIAILGILTLAVAGFLSFGMKGFQRTNEIVDEQAMIRLSTNRVTEILRNAKTLEIIDASAVPTNITDDKIYIYVDTSNNTLRYRDLSVDKSLSGDRIGSISFEIINGSKVFLEFTIISDRGYTVNSTILLNNFGTNVENGALYLETFATSGNAVKFTLPIED